jgi:hypothetical protein
MAAHSRKSEPSAGRYTDQLKLRAQPALVEAIDRAAAKNFTTASEYVRQKLITGLRADGVDLLGAA